MLSFKNFLESMQIQHKSYMYLSHNHPVANLNAESQIKYAYICANYARRFLTPEQHRMATRYLTPLQTWLNTRKVDPNDEEIDELNQLSYDDFINNSANIRLAKNNEDVFLETSALAFATIVAAFRTLLSIANNRNGDVYVEACVRDITNAYRLVAYDLKPTLDKHYEMLLATQETLTQRQNFSYFANDNFLESFCNKVEWNYEDICIILDYLQEKIDIDIIQETPKGLRLNIINPKLKYQIEAENIYQLAKKIDNDYDIKELFRKFICANAR